jgi:hypothetical protein
MTEPLQNYVWTVVNRITGITIKAFYSYDRAEQLSKTSEDFIIMRLAID